MVASLILVLRKSIKRYLGLKIEQTDALTKDMIRKIAKAKESFGFVEDKEDHDFLSMFSFICMLSFDVYMRKHIIEQIIDNSLKPYMSSKEQEEHSDIKEDNKDPNMKNNKSNNKNNNKGGAKQ